MKQKAILIEIAILAVLIFNACTQKSGINGPYFGQKPPGITREIFAPGIVSTGYNEHGISFTPDGMEAYWRMLGAPHGVTLTSMEERGKWDSPRVASFSGKYDGKCSLSPDGNTLIISNGSPPSGEGPALKFWTMWLIRRQESGWEEPINLPHLRGACPTMSNNGTIYFYARGENNKGDIYRSVYEDGEYSEAQRLEAPINTEHWENDPYIAPDESFLIFQSSRPGTLGEGDLFISYRGDNGRWTDSQNLGEGINSERSGEGCPWVTPDGKYLFFSSGTWTLPNYSENPMTYEEKVRILNEPGHGSEDIFWVDARVIDELKPNHVK